MLLRAIEKILKVFFFKKGKWKLLELSEKMYIYKNFAKNYNFEELYVYTSVENQIWLTDRTAGVHIGDI